MAGLESHAIKHQDFNVWGSFKERDQLILARTTGDHEIWQTASIRCRSERCSTSLIGVKPNGKADLNEQATQIASVGQDFGKCPMEYGVSVCQ